MGVLLEIRPQSSRFPAQFSRLICIAGQCLGEPSVFFVDRFDIFKQRCPHRAEFFEGRLVVLEVLKHGLQFKKFGKHFNLCCEIWCFAVMRLFGEPFVILNEVLLCSMAWYHHAVDQIIALLNQVRERLFLFDGGQHDVRYRFISKGRGVLGFVHCEFDGF